MSTTITNVTTGAAIAPTLLVGFSPSNAVGGIDHRLAGGGSAYTLAPAQKRAGTMGLLFPSYAPADAARAILTGAALFTFADSDVGAFTFVTTGTVALDIDPATRAVWIVTLGFSEV